METPEDKLHYLFERDSFVEQESTDPRKRLLLSYFLPHALQCRRSILYLTEETVLRSRGKPSLLRILDVNRRGGKPFDDTTGKPAQGKYVVIYGGGVSQNFNPIHKFFTNFHHCVGVKSCEEL